MTVERIFFIALVISGILFWQSWEGQPEVHAPGVLVSDMPLQTRVAERTFDFEGHQVTQRARFELGARVLSRRNYRFDGGAALSPVDLALGWGPMSDQAVLDQLEISQSSRWYRLKWNPAPIPERDIMGHSSNMHIIPANPVVEDALDRVKAGQLVQLEGYLVDVRGDNGFIWTTSLSRDDTGDGACELFYVERLSFR
jgi:hypothetical protein